MKTLHSIPRERDSFWNTLPKLNEYITGISGQIQLLNNTTAQTALRFNQLYNGYNTTPTYYNALDYTAYGDTTTAYTISYNPALLAGSGMGEVVQTTYRDAVLQYNPLAYYPLNEVSATFEGTLTPEFESIFSDVDE